MPRSWTRRAAILSILSGAGVLLTESRAFSSVKSNRSANVSVATDANAYLGLEDQSNGASIGGPDESATVYAISDNIGRIPASSIDITVPKLIEQNGNEIPGPPVTASVNTVSSGEYSVDLSCSTESDSLGASYAVVLDIAVDTGNLSIAATRTTTSYVDITCAFDYGDSSNYRDDDSGGAAQPSNPKGDIEDPGAVNTEDGSGATAISRKGGQSAKVGFALPTQPASSSYELEVEVLPDGPALTGTWVVYLVDRSGTRLTSNQELSRGENIFTFSASENDAIRNSRDELYLIFATTSKGNKNSVEIDYFDLRPA